MKKTICFILVLITAICCASCGEKMEENAKVSMLCDYESVQELEDINYVSTTGLKLSLNEDKKYVTNGNNSMYIEFDGSYKVPMPNFYFSFNAVLFYPHLTHFSEFGYNFENVDYFSVDIFNASDRDSKVYMRIDTQYGNYYYTEDVMLLKDKMNHVVFDIDTVKAVNVGITDVNTINIVFDKVNETQTPLKFYIDNFTATEYKDGEKPSAPSLPQLERGEIAFFEDGYLADTLITAKPEGNYIEGVKFFEIENNSNPDFVKEGDYSLKITRFPCDSQTTPWRKSLDINFPTAYVNAIDFTLGGEITEENLSNYNIEFDVYNDYEFVVDFVFKITSATGYINSVDYLSPKEWNHIVLPMNTKTTSGNEYTNNHIDWTKVSALQVLLHEYYGGEQAYMYVDNMKIVKAN